MGGQEPGVAQALVGLALDEEAPARDDSELLLIGKLDVFEFLTRLALGGFELRGDGRVFEAELAQTVASRLYTREAGAGGQEPLGAAWLVEPEPMHERRYRRGVQEQGRENHTARHGDERIALGQRLGQGEREGQSDPAAQPTPDQDRLVAPAHRRYAGEPLQRRDQRHDGHGAG